MAKSSEAFRTISEVADWLGTPAHVLRFWESKFSQVKPVKRAGGRRYYRPADMELIGGIKRLLHDDGMTIKGVQKILREKGVKHVAALSHSLEAGPTEDTAAAVMPAAAPKPPAPPTPQQISEPADITPDTTIPDAPLFAIPPEELTPNSDMPTEKVPQAPVEPFVEMLPEAAKTEGDDLPGSLPEVDPVPVQGAISTATPAYETHQATPEEPPEPPIEPAPVAPSGPNTEEPEPAEDAFIDPTPIPAFGSSRTQPAAPSPVSEPSQPARPLTEDTVAATPPVQHEPAPIFVDVPADPADGDTPATPGILTALLAADPGEIRANAVRVLPLLKRLEALQQNRPSL